MEQVLQLCAYGAVFLGAQIVAQLDRHIICPDAEHGGAEYFADETFCAVAIYGPRGRFFSADHAQSRVDCRVSQSTRDEITGRNAHTQPQDRLELAGPT